MNTTPGHQQDPLSTTKKYTESNCIRYSLAGVFGAAFVISVILILFTYFPTRQLLNPDFYKQILIDKNVYHNLPDSIAKQLATSITEERCDPNTEEQDCTPASSSNTPVYLFLLNQDQWETIISEIVNPAWLQTQTESILDRFFYILLDSPDPVNTNLEFSLQEVKRRLAGPEGTQAFIQILEAQNPCSIDQLLGLVQLGLGMPTEIESLLCQPPDYILDSLTPTISTFLSSMVDLIPDQLTYYLPFGQLDEQSSGKPLDQMQPIVPEFISNLRRANNFITWSPLVPLFLLSLVTIFAVRSIKDLFLWWGSTFLIAGLISLSILLFSNLAVDWAVTQILPDELYESFGLLTIIISLGFGEIINILGERVLLTVLIPASVITFIGLMGLVGFVLLNQRLKKPEIQPVTASESIFSEED
jgi:hypothetical protein